MAEEGPETPGPTSWSVSLDEKRFLALLERRMTVCVTARAPFRTVTVAVVSAGEGDRFVPAGTRIRRIPLYIMP